MQPNKKPMNWLLIILGFCCLSGVCTSGIAGAIFFFRSAGEKGLAKNFERLNEDAADNAELGRPDADVPAMTPEEEPQPSGQRWLDPGGRYSIVFPNDWAISEPEGLDVMGMSPYESDADMCMESVNISQEEIPPGYTGEDYIEATDVDIATLTNYRELDRGPWTKDGNTGVWIEYTADIFEGATSHNLVFIGTQPGRAYVVTCSSIDADFARWEDQLRAVAETFRLE